MFPAPTVDLNALQAAAEDLNAILAAQPSSNGGEDQRVQLKVRVKYGFIQ
jgi:hypothetical protein